MMNEPVFWQTPPRYVVAYSIYVSVVRVLALTVVKIQNGWTKKMEEERSIRFSI